MLNRRRFLGTGAGALAASGLSMPAVRAASAAKTLRFVPQANLANFDPIWGTQIVVRNAAVLVWDMLYGVDADLKPQRQMAEAEEVTADGLTWTFRLRPGLKFHDGEPVLARDVVVSLARWCVRDPMGQYIRAIQSELVAVDDRTVRWVLTKPFPRLLLALGKTNSPCAFIMPERIARTDPYRQITEYVGSGPMTFARGEWIPGARAVFERFADYRPRSEPASWLAGGKRVLVDRIEWQVMPDPATAAAALQAGEIDWWENPIPDLVPLLRRNREIEVGIADNLGQIGAFRMNHLQPPFDNPQVRRAVLMALNQEDYMRAVVGNDDELWKPLPSFFTPGTPLYTEAGGDILKARDLTAARKLLATSGYRGEPVVCLLAQDQPTAKAFGDVTVDLLQKLGMNVDAVTTDWGTVGTRRASKAPPANGGWSMFHTWHAGADCINPSSYLAIRANGDKAWFGWPDLPQVEGAIASWFQAGTVEDERKALAVLNRAAMEGVVYAPTGFFLAHQAWRKSVTGIAQGPIPVPWNVVKS